MSMRPIGPVSTSEKDELASFSGFHKLQQVNPEGSRLDQCLWHQYRLSLVVQTKDNEKYLNKDSKGRNLQLQELFFLRLEMNLSSKTLIPSSTDTHVENGVMFGDVAKFSDKGIF